MLSAWLLGVGAIVRGAQAHTLAITAEPRAARVGDVVLLTITGAASQPKVAVFGHDIPAYRDGEVWRALVGIDLDTRAGRYTAAVTAGAGRATYAIDVAARTFPTRKLTVDPAFVNPPPAAQARIAADNKRLAAVWASPAHERLWTSPFVRPVPQAANSAFGTRSVFNNTPRSPHGGADFMSPAGESIKAPNAGRVAVARDLYFSGNTVVVDHGQGLFSTLAHLSAIDVREGDTIAVGQVVGKVGATGRVTGPHLHWAVRLNGARVDPLALLAVLGRE